MKLGVRVTPSLGKIYRDWSDAGEKAVTSAMDGAGKALKEDWREQIVAAGLGARLARTIRSATYPTNTMSMNAAALVWAKAPKIVAAFEEGALIKSKDGLFLAIPLPAAGKGSRGTKISPARFEERTGLALRMIYRPGRPSLLVAEARLSSRGTASRSRSKTGQGVASVPVFVLLPQVRLRKRLSLYPAVEHIASAIPASIVAKWRDD